jgi:hypothetical protein
MVSADYTVYLVRTIFDMTTSRRAFFLRRVHSVQAVMRRALRIISTELFACMRSLGLDPADEMVLEEM